MRTIDIYLPSDKDDLNLHDFSLTEKRALQVESKGTLKDWAYAYPKEIAPDWSIKLVRAHERCTVPQTSTCSMLRESLEKILIYVLDEITDKDFKDVTVHFFLHIGGTDEYGNITDELNNQAQEIAEKIGIKSLFFFCWGANDSIYNKYVSLRENKLPLPGDSDYIRFLEILKMRADRIIPTIDEIHELWDPIAGILSIGAHPDNMQEKGKELKEKLEELISAVEKSEELWKILIKPRSVSEKSDGQKSQEPDKPKDIVKGLIDSIDVSDDERCLEWSKRMYYACEKFRADREN